MDELVVLDKDREYARRRVEELDAELLALGPEFYDVLNQSSETWHDNAPFDALRDRQSVLVAEQSGLKDMLRKCRTSVPPQKKNKIGIGATVTVRNKKTEATKAYFIAGDWTAKAGSVVDGAIVISRKSPLGVKLFDKCVGDEITMRDTLTIESFEYIP